MSGAGDLAHYFFVAQGRKGALRNRKELETLQKHVTALNKELRNTKADALATICKNGAVLAVAGGPSKASAVECVLRPEMRTEENKDLWVTHLVVDDLCARYVLEDDKDRESMAG